MPVRRGLLMSKFKRKRFYVDSKIQGALMLRVTAYWLFCLLTMTGTLFAWQSIMTPTRLMHTHFNDMLFHYGPAIVVAVLLLPFVILDVLRLSNRFVGPFLRLRGAMRQVVQGEDVEPIRFRKGDFWREFAEEFNALVGRIKAAEERLGSQQVAEEPAKETTCASSE
jgi:hypothetical protein